MIILTKYLGETEIQEKHIITFPSGLPGFPDEDKFVLLHIPENPVFQILQSINTQSLAFIVTNPHQFYKDYEFTLDEGIIELLKIQSERDISVLSTVTLKEPFKQSTLNLKAPLIINSNNLLGKQYVLHTDDYSMQASISPASRKENT